MKKRIVLKVLKEENGYSASGKFRDVYLFAMGDNLSDLKADINSALYAAFDGAFTFDDCLMEYDIDSLFHFYSIINAKALSIRIGMNQSLLAQYISGIKKPSIAQKTRILKGIHQIGKELSELNLILKD